MRRVAVILALLAFGAAAQIGVAYALALRAWEVADDPWPRELMMGGWPGPVPDEWKKEPGGIIIHPQRVTSMSSVAWDWQALSGRGNATMYQFNAWRMGWPFRSLGAYRHGQRPDLGRIFREPPAWTPRWQAEWIKGYVQPPAKAGDPPRVWPMYPIWSGFALNTLIFAAVPAGVWWVAGWARRSRRRQRGMCVACGYELAGLAMCPECGTLRSGDKQMSKWQIEDEVIAGKSKP